MPDYDASEQRRPRPFWSGTISFGLVSIPVDLYSANRSTGLSLRMLDEDGTPLSRRYYCSNDGKEIDWGDIVRGYEVDDGEFVVVTDDELESLEPEKSRDIDLRRFVDSDAIDPMLFQRAYFLTPAEGTTKAYRLLAQTMEERSKAGIATFVMRGKEYLVAIFAAGGILRAETLRFADEIRAPEDIGLPEPATAPRATVKKMAAAMSKLAEKTLDESELEDPVSGRIMELVESKEDEALVETTRAPAPDAGVIDIMEVLKQRLGAKDAGSSKGGSGARRSAKNTKSAAKDDALSDRTKDELYEQAKSLGIEGRSRMSRDQLIRAIRRSA